MPKERKKRHTGNKICDPATTANGKITAHALPSTRHSRGTNVVEQITIPAMIITDTRSGNQNRLKIFGISLKKLLRCTSFIVADHVMLYEKRCARIACDTGIASPPKKKKLRGRQQHHREWKKGKTNKKGIHFRFSKNPQSSSRWPRRYSRSVYPTFPDPKNTTVVASQISNECM